MNQILLAADWGEVVVPLIVFAIYGISHVIRAASGDKKKPAARKPPKLPAAENPRPAKQADPFTMEQPRVVTEVAPASRPDQPPANPQQQELEKLLDQLGLRRPPADPKQPPNHPSVRRPPKPPKPQQKQKKREPSTQRASDRQLHSRLEQRSAHEVHSKIERKHLESKVEHRPQDTETAVDPAASIKESTPDRMLASLLADSNLLRRAYVLGIVLGPPKSLGDDRSL